MSCKTLLVERNGVAISVTQWDATTGLSKLESILEVMGDTALPLILGEGAFPNFLSIVRRKGSIPLMQDLITTATVAVEGVPVSSSNFEELVNTNYQLVFDLLSVVLEVNFRTFFEQGLNSLTPEGTVEKETESSTMTSETN